MTEEFERLCRVIQRTSMIALFLLIIPVAIRMFSNELNNPFFFWFPATSILFVTVASQKILGKLEKIHAEKWFR